MKLAAIVTSIFIPLFCIAQPGNLEIIGEGMVSGAYREGTILGNYLFIATRYGVEKISLVDPRNPRVVDRVKTGGDAQSLAAYEQYAYVTTGLPGLVVVAFGAGANGRFEIVNRIAPPDSAFSYGRCEVSGQTLLVYGYNHIDNNGSRFLAYSLADPENPELIGSFRKPDYFENWTFTESYIVFAFATWFYVYSLEDLESPQLLSTVDVPLQYAYFWSQPPVIQEDALFLPLTPVVGGQPYLLIYSLEDPANPELLSRLNRIQSNHHNTVSIGIVGDIAYVRSPDEYTTRVIDISDLEHPRVIRSVELPIGHPIALSPNFLLTSAYMSQNSGQEIDAYGQFYVQSLENPQQPVLRATVNPSSNWLNDFDIRGDYAYMVKGGIATLDISDFENIRQVHLLEDRHARGHVLIHQDYLFAMGNGFKLLSLRDPDAPSVAYDGGGNDFEDPEFRGQQMFIPRYSNGLEIYDVRQLAQPSLLSTYDNFRNDVFQIEIKDNVAYVAEDYRTLHVLDISDIENINSIEEITISGIYEMEVVDDVLIVIHQGEESVKMKLFDISEPASPNLLYELSSAGERLEVWGSMIITGGGLHNDEIRIHQLRDNEPPVVMGRLFSTAIEDFKVKGDQLHVASRFSYQIYDLSPLALFNELSLSETSVEFFDAVIEEESRHFLRISNFSENPVPINSIRIDGDAFAVDRINDFELGSGLDTTIMLQFFPDNTITYEGQLTIASGNYEIAVRVTGTGLDPLDLPGDPPGERVIVGHTWHDTQFSTTAGRKTELDRNGNLHCIWMNSNRPTEGFSRRTVFYNLISNLEPHYSGGIPVDCHDRNGFANLNLDAQGGPIISYHSSQLNNTRFNSKLGWMTDDERGEFRNVNIPQIDNVAFTWPTMASGDDNRRHIVSAEHVEGGQGVDIRRLQYQIAQQDEDLAWSFDDPVILDSVVTLSYVIEKSPVSGKVAIAYLRPAYSFDDPLYENFYRRYLIGQSDNNVILYESDDNGEFDWDQRINVTSFLRPDTSHHPHSQLYWGDTLRCFTFLDACYDHQDNLHIIFSTVRTVGPILRNDSLLAAMEKERNFLWHWDRNSGESHLVANAFFTPGGNDLSDWTSNLSFPSIAAHEDGNLYVTYTLFPQFDCRAANGFVNGEIYSTVSLDGGFSWAVPTNLTNTPGQNSRPMSGVSESWSGLARQVDDNLHISYLFDRDPGTFEYGDGSATNNPIVYHRIPTVEVATEPLIEDRPLHIEWPPRQPRHFVLEPPSDIKHEISLLEINLESFDANVDTSLIGCEIGLFTLQGVLSGTGVWNENGITIAAWGCGDAGAEHGFLEGDSILFRFWDYKTGFEEGAVPLLHEGELTWAQDGFAVVSLYVRIPVERNLQLQPGWNTISLNIIPDKNQFWTGEFGPDVVRLFDQLRDENGENALLILKSSTGQFYLPGRNFNNIPYWDLSRGYMARVVTATDVSWFGSPIPPDSVIQIPAGWSLISYFPNYPLSATSPDFAALAPIIDHVILAKDYAGRFMRPESGFSNMVPWIRGQGYQIKLSRAVEFSYPLQEGQNVEIARMVSTTSTPRIHYSQQYEKNTISASEPASTGEDMSVLALIPNQNGVNNAMYSNDTTYLNAQLSKMQIVAINRNGLMVGAGNFIHDACGLAVRGDDPTTDQVDGLNEGEKFDLYLQNLGDTEMKKLAPDRFLEGTSLVYHKDGIIVVELSPEVLLPTELYLNQNYPNPFNGVTIIRFGLPKTELIQIEIYDLMGRLVAEVYNDLKPAGNHTINFDGSSLVSGVYVIRLQSAGLRIERKIVLLK